MKKRTVTLILCLLLALFSMVRAHAEAITPASTAQAAAFHRFIHASSFSHLPFRRSFPAVGSGKAQKRETLARLSFYTV